MQYFQEAAYVAEIEKLKAEIRLLEIQKEELKAKMEKKEEVIDGLESRIRNELEPRIQAEHRSYDAWVTTDPSAEGCDHWQALLDEMIAMVEENPTWFDWETMTGNLDEQILYVIKHRDSVVISGAEYIKFREYKHNARN